MATIAPHYLHHAEQLDAVLRRRSDAELEIISRFFDELLADS
jgi:hypothetical protein